MQPAALLDAGNPDTHPDVEATSVGFYSATGVPTRWCAVELLLKQALGAYGPKQRGLRQARDSSRDGAEKRAVAPYACDGRFQCHGARSSKRSYDPPMSVGPVFHQYVLEQLARTGHVISRRMFGAVGLYCDDRFFAVIDDDTLFFKVDDSTRADYVSRGMKPFRPYKDKPDVSMNYYTVPADVLDDAEELVQWARRSVAIAMPRPVKKPKPSPSAAPRSSASKPLSAARRARRAQRASSPSGKRNKTKR